MEFIIEKEILSANLKIVEKTTVARGIQPVLSNILIEAFSDNHVRFSATDLDINIVSKTVASVKTEGKITLPAKKLSEMAARFSNNPVTFSLNSSTNIVNITCGNTKFELIGISADEFPSVIDENEFKNKSSVEIELEPFVKSIKHTAFSAANYEKINIISGVYCLISSDKLEMAATDGNRLTRNVETIKSSIENDLSCVIPSKTLQEFLRIAALIDDTKVSLIIEKARIILKTNNIIMISRLLEGEYPPYKQLIPQTCEKNAVIGRAEMIDVLERVSVMVNERTNIVKFIFGENKLFLKADTPDAGVGEDSIVVDYPDEELTIAFNYKYVLDSLKIMESEKIKIGMGGSLSAALFRPQSEDNYLCLIMPVQIR
jgi:DNA polymerase-3 subunit beta